jgi:hypothetical protein
VYHDDCLLQMESKLLGDAYNKLNPPKPVDFLQTYMLEMPRADGAQRRTVHRRAVPCELIGASLQHSLPRVGAGRHLGAPRARPLTA